MAKPWIKMRCDLADDPEVLRVKQLCALADKFAVIGRLHAFWSWWDEKSRNGRVDGAVTVDIDEIVHAPGFGAALVAVKWLGEDADGLYMPEYERHNGRAAKERALGNQRQEAYRSRNGNGDGNKTPSSRTNNADRVIRSRSSSSNKHPTVTSSTSTAQPPRTATPVEKPDPPTPPLAGNAELTHAPLQPDAGEAAPIPAEVRDAIRRRAVESPGGARRTRAFREPKTTVPAPRPAAPPVEVEDPGPSTEPEGLAGPDEDPLDPGEGQEGIAWWRSDELVLARAVEEGVRVIPDQPWPEFVARVYAASGPGPWLDEADEHVRDLAESWKRRGVNPPMSESGRRQPIQRR